MTVESQVGTLLRRTVRRVLGDDAEREDGRCRLGPEWLVLVVNNFCNLHCRMCDVGLGETGSVFWAHMIGQDRRNMSLELLARILDQAAAFRPRPRIGLAFTEPLIHPRIVEFCRLVTGRGFFCSITSNGSTLPRLAQPLVEAGLDEITISIDGPEELHDRIRGRRGSFRNLFEGVEALNRAKGGRGRPRVKFSYTITDENAGAMLDFVRAVEVLRPDALCFSHLNFITDEMAAAHNAVADPAFRVARSNLGVIEPERIDLGAMWNALTALRAYAGSRPDFPILTIVPDLGSRAELDVYYREHVRFVGGRTCTDPWRMMMVRTDGTVIPAHSRCYDVALGNVESSTLAGMWNGPGATSFRRTLRAAGGTLPACARCCGVIGKPARDTGRGEAAALAAPPGLPSRAAPADATARGGR